MITNETGQQGVVYFQPIPKLITVGKNSYYFNPQWAISWAWVNPEDVPALLALKGGCCGGHHPVCHLANQLEFNVYSTGHY
jgi:hypothetical protein